MSNWTDTYTKLIRAEHPDAEEIIDLFVHRPIARLLSRFTEMLTMQRRQEIFIAIALGLGAALFLYNAAFDLSFMSGGTEASYVMAALLLILTSIFHRGAYLDPDIQPKQTDRTLFDILVFGPIFVVIASDIAERFGATWGWVAVAAGVNVAIQLYAFRKLQQVFVEKSSGPNGKAFSELFSGVMRIITFLGPETHLLMLYLACWFAWVKPIALLACMLSYVTTFNFALGVAISHGRKMLSYE